MILLNLLSKLYWETKLMRYGKGFISGISSKPSNLDTNKFIAVDYAPAQGQSTDELGKHSGSLYLYN